MSLNSTPSGERLHIAFFGIRNAGKSSLVNAVTGQDMSLVSEIKGTTTDPVKKAMELLPVGPVVIIDTPGFDDEGTLGEMRVKKTKETLEKTDFAVLVVDAEKGLSDEDKELILLFNSFNLPYLIAYNKSDLTNEEITAGENEIYVSAKLGYNIQELKEIIAKRTLKVKEEKPLLDDIIKAGDSVILVTPIDESAPKGRLILPQQLTLRNILDNNCTALVCKETELESALKLLTDKPSIVITDSQVFGFVNKVLPKDVRLTSFSIIMARYKGELAALIEGALMLGKLNDGDKVLICEGCTHHRQCNDIGTVKMPNWIKEFTKKNIEFDFSSGGDFTENLGEYSLVVHCGGCMLGNKEMQARITNSKKAGVPIVNYGVAIAYMHGILERSIEVFPEARIVINAEEEDL